MNDAWLLDFRADVYSQTGEDGIIQRILAALPERDGWCVEFGALDGVEMANTRNLIQNHGYSAVLIEGDAAKFRRLQENYRANPRVQTMNRYVGLDSAGGLDMLLAPTAVPQDFDFLSIDIDGNDYHAWNAVTAYEPKVVCVEFNPTIPTDVVFVQPPDQAIQHGASVSALAVLGKAKGYELVAVLPWNAFFVRAGYFHLFEIGDNAPRALRKHLDAVTYIFSGFDGTVLLRGSRRLPWHGIPLTQSRVQHLPKPMRRYPGDYGRLERLALLAYRVLTNRRRALGAVGRLIRRRNA